jgi:hypothetical protein
MLPLDPRPLRDGLEHYVAVLLADGMDAAEAERRAAGFMGLGMPEASSDHSTHTRRHASPCWIS